MAISTSKDWNGAIRGALIDETDGTLSEQVRVLGGTITPSGTQDVNITKFGGTSVTIGQKTSAASLPVTIASDQTLGLSVTDEAAWTGGASQFTPSGGVFNDSATALTSGQQGTERLTANRAVHSNLRNASGTEMGTSSNPLQVSLANTGANGTALKVDGSAVTQPISGSVSLSSGSAVIGHVITDSGSVTTATLSAETTKVIGTVNQGTSPWVVAGNVASGIADSGNPVKIGGVFNTTAPIFTNGQRGDFQMTSRGELNINSADSVTTGSLSSGNSAVDLACPGGDSTWTVELTGTWDAVIQFYLSYSGDAVLKQVYALQVDSQNGIPVNQVTSTNGTWSGNTAGATNVRIVCSAYNSGTINIRIRTSSGTRSTNLISALPPGSNLIGKVSIDQTTPGTTNLVALTAETTKAIGVVRNSDGAGNLLTSNSTTFTAKFALDGNLLGTKGTAFTTAGFVDIKGADGDVFVRQATATNLKAQVVAGDATAASVPSNAHYSAFRGTTALPTAVTDGQLVGGMADKFGRPVSLIGAPRDLIGTATLTITSSTAATSFIAAQGSGVFADIYWLSITNISSTATEVTLSDGTVSYTLWAPATDIRGISVSVFLPATTANTAWTLKTVTSIASLKASVGFVKNK